MSRIVIHLLAHMRTYSLCILSIFTLAYMKTQVPLFRLLIKAYIISSWSWLRLLWTRSRLLRVWRNTAFTVLLVCTIVKNNTGQSQKVPLNGTAVISGSWIEQCPYHAWIASHLCQHDFDRVIRYFASGSCFDADYEKQWCCPQDSAGVVLPDCFIPDGFNSLNERLCCHGDLSTLRIPELTTPLVDARSHREKGKCVVNGQTVDVSLHDAVQEMCPAAAEPYQLVLYLWHALRGTPRQPAPVELDDWCKAIKGRYPLFGLLNSFAVTPETKATFTFSPGDLEIPRRKVIAYLYLAIEYFDMKDSRWESLVAMAQASFVKWGFVRTFILTTYFRE